MMPDNRHLDASRFLLVEEMIGDIPEIRQLQVSSSAPATIDRKSSNSRSDSVSRWYSNRSARGIHLGEDVAEGGGIRRLADSWIG